MIYKILKYIPKTQYSFNFLYSARVNVLNQFFSLLSFPVLSIIYKPEDFGIFAIYNSYLAVMLSFSMLRVDWYIPNLNDKLNTTLLVYIGLIANTIFGILYIVYMLINYGYHEINSYLLILPIQLTLSNIQLIYEALYVQKNNLKIIYNIKLVQNLSNITFSILIGYYTNIGQGLIYGYFISFLLSAILNKIYFKDLVASNKKVNFIKIYEYFMEMKKILISNTISCVVNVFSFSSIPIFLAYQYSLDDIGIYSTMLRFANAPFMFITSSVSSSFWSESTALSKINAKRILPLYLNSLKKLFILSIFASFIILLSPYYIYYIFVGPKWMNSSTILITLIPMIIGTISISPLNHLWVMNKSHFQIISDLIRILLVIVSILYSHYYNLSFYKAVFLVSISSLISHIINIFINIHCNKVLYHEI